MRSAHVRNIYMRYAVQVATETEKTTYYPEKKIDRMKITTRRRKIDIKIEKNHKCKREEREKSSIQARTQ